MTMGYTIMTDVFSHTYQCLPSHLPTSMAWTLVHGTHLAAGEDSHGVYTGEPDDGHRVDVACVCGVGHWKVFSTSS